MLTWWISTSAGLPVPLLALLSLLDTLTSCLDREEGHCWAWVALRRHPLLAMVQILKSKRKTLVSSSKEEETTKKDPPRAQTTIDIIWACFPCVVASLFGVVAGMRAVETGFPPDSGGGSDEGGKEGRQQWCRWWWWHELAVTTCHGQLAAY
jgi:hypothetical protein